MYRPFIHFLTGACILLLTQCSPDQQFTVGGTFSVADPTPVKLFLLTSEEAVLIDSSHTEDGKFQLSGTSEYAGIYLLKFFNDQRIFLIVHPGDDIDLEIDNSTEWISYYVKNSLDSKWVKELTDRQNQVLRTFDQLSEMWSQAGSDSTLRHTIDSTYHATLRDHRDSTRDFILKHPHSLATLMAVYQNLGRNSQSLFDPYDDHKLFSFVDSNLTTLYPNTAAVQALNKEVNDIRSQIQQKKLIEKIVEEGRPFPPFAYPKLHGDTIRLSGYSGKPAVLLFWATWNSYSVSQLQALNTLACTPAARKLDIVTISLDTSPELLDTFLVRQNIQVPVVCDYAYWDSEIPARYAVKRIPSSLLINTQGVIVGKDIFGTDLDYRINALLP